MIKDWKKVKTAKVKTNGYKAINGYDITLVVKNGTLDGDKLINETLEDKKIEGDQPETFNFEHTIQPTAGYVLPEEITDKDGNKIEEATITAGKVAYTAETLTSDVTLVATCVALPTTTTTVAPTTTTTPEPPNESNEDSTNTDNEGDDENEVIYYDFVSYGSETGNDEYGNGQVKVVDVSGEYTEIEIVNNSVLDNESFVKGKHFFVKTDVEDGQRRQLYVKNVNDTLAAIDVWVKVTRSQD